FELYTQKVNIHITKICESTPIKKMFTKWLNNEHLNEEVNSATFYEVRLINKFDSTLYYATTKSPINNKNLCVQLAKRIMVCDTITNSTKPGLKVFCLPFDHKRDILKKQFTNVKIDLAELNHLHQALTISGETRNQQIILTKAEGVAKLLVHELIHYYDLDGERLVNGGTTYRSIVKNWCSSSLDDNCYEAYTECLSNVLNCVFTACEFKLSNTTVDIMAMTAELLNIERIYSVYAAAKLLYVYGYTRATFRQFFDSADKCIDIKVNIPAIYYYIVRSMLFFNINDLLDSQMNTMMDDKKTAKLIELEIATINKCTQADSAYMKLLAECFDMVARNDDFSLSYICIDTNANKFDFINSYVDASSVGTCVVIDYKYLKL
ncbi:MAG: hypothetical protein Faunusvirus3_39, partial [Faunusvirus sp.]